MTMAKPPERRFLARVDAFADERHGRLLVAHQPREMEARRDGRDARKRGDAVDFRAVVGQQERERIRASMLMPAGARDLDVTELRVDRLLAHVVENPLDEAAGEEQGDDAAGHRAD